MAEEVVGQVAPDENITVIGDEEPEVTPSPEDQTAPSPAPQPQPKSFLEQIREIADPDALPYLNTDADARRYVDLARAEIQRIQQAKETEYAETVARTGDKLLDDLTDEILRNTELDAKNPAAVKVARGIAKTMTGKFWNVLEQGISARDKQIQSAQQTEDLRLRATGAFIQAHEHEWPPSVQRNAAKAYYDGMAEEDVIRHANAETMELAKWHGLERPPLRAVPQRNRGFGQLESPGSSADEIDSDEMAEFAKKSKAYWKQRLG